MPSISSKITLRNVNDCVVYEVAEKLKIQAAAISGCSRVGCLLALVCAKLVVFSQYVSLILRLLGVIPSVRFSGKGGKNKRSRRGIRNPADRNRVSREVSLKTTPSVSHQRGASSSKHHRSSTTAAKSIEQLRRREPETREQILAMAQGGLRYRQMVFHRKGFRLTEDSPRSVRPREVRVWGPIESVSSNGTTVAYRFFS